MARNIDPKCKQCRRANEKLFLKGERCFSSKCAMVKRNYPPGDHGPKGMGRLSQYGLQLKEKQKLVKSYRLLEKQFRNYFVEAKKIKEGTTGDNLLKFLEMRLDNSIYRLGIAKSRDKARQIVTHGHVLVNGKKVDIPSYQIKQNDTLSIRKESLNNKLFKDIVKKINKKDMPTWISFVNENDLEAKVLETPTKNDLPDGINMAMIVEYYSR